MEIEEITCKNYTREQIIYLIQLSERCGRYEDMLTYFEILITKYGVFYKNEKNLLEKPIKNFVQNKQKKLNKLYHLQKEAKKQEEENTNSPLFTVLNEEKECIENEIRVLCNNFISLVDNVLTKNQNDKELEIFYFRLKGDLFKYLSQIEENDKEYLQKAELNFKEAVNSGKHLDMFNSSNLATFLSYAKFLSNYLKNEKEGLKILKTIFNHDKFYDYLNSEKQEDSEIILILKEIKQLVTDVEV